MIAIDGDIRSHPAEYINLSLLETVDATHRLLFPRAGRSKSQYGHPIREPVYGIPYSYHTRLVPRSSSVFALSYLTFSSRLVIVIITMWRISPFCSVFQGKCPDPPFLYCVQDDIAIVVSLMISAALVFVFIKDGRLMRWVDQASTGFVLSFSASHLFLFSLLNYPFLLSLLPI